MTSQTTTPGILGVSDAREKRYRTLLDRYIRHLSKLSNQDLDLMIKLNAFMLKDAVLIDQQLKTFKAESAAERINPIGDCP